jgi:hypothetical protein
MTQDRTETTATAIGDTGSTMAVETGNHGRVPTGRPGNYRLRPHSRLLERGTVSGRSREGRFLASIEAQLAQHVAPGGQPSIAQKLLIRRVSRAMLQLELLDEKKRITDHDLRLGNALDNRVRLGLKALGLKPGAAKPGPTLAEVMAAHKPPLVP